MSQNSEAQSRMLRTHQSCLSSDAWIQREEDAAHVDENQKWGAGSHVDGLKDMIYCSNGCLVISVIMFLLLCYNICVRHIFL